MTLTAKGQFSGLMTATSELSAPPGALRRADNVVIRKPGAIQCRQAQTPVALTGWVTGVTLEQSVDHAGQVIYWDGASWRNGVVNRYHLTLPGTYPVPLRGDSVPVAFARGNMYFAHTRGVFRACLPGDFEWLGSGFIAANMAFTSVNATFAAGVILPNNCKLSYRIVPVRKDANGMTVRGRPSGELLVFNTSGSTKNVEVAFTTLGATGGSLPQSIEVYRSRVFPIGITTDDEMALVGVIDTPISNFYTFLDTVLDSQRGVALYTSPSRGGSENANDAPPACAFMELYRGHLFFGNIAGPQRFVVSFSGSDRSGLATGIGLRFGTWNTTNGSPIATAVTPVTGIQPGMMAEVGGLQRYVTSVVGTTVTFSGNFSATAAAVPFSISDAIEVDGYWYGLFHGALPSLMSFGFSGVFNTSVYMITPPISGKGYTAVIEGTLPNGPALSIRATHGNEMEPPLPLYGATAETSTGDVYPNGLIYSEPDQPEHVPPKNFMLIGDKSKAILGLATTRDSMFVFKEDGIWRLSGINGQWRVDPFDMTTFCVLPSSIKKMDNRVYLLSNKGVVRVSEQGTELLSSSIADVVAKLVDDCIANNAALGYYKLTGLDGSAAAVDGRNNEYRLLVGSNTLVCGGQELVYNARTDAWTTFSYVSTGATGFTPTGLGTGLSNAPLLLHVGGARVSDYATSAALEAVPIAYDAVPVAVTITFSGSYPGFYQANFSGGYLPAVGDLLIAGAYSYQVLEDTTAGVAILSAAGSHAVAPPTGAATFYRAIHCTVQPHGFGNPVFVGKLWQTILLAASRFVGAYKVAIDYTSAEPLLPEASQTTAETILMPGTLYWSNYVGTLLRQLVPRAHARSWMLRPTLTWSMAFGDVVLESIAAEARDNSLNRNQQNSTAEG